jgi:hypothetical protein
MMPRLTGRWQIFEMDLWDRDAIDLLGPAIIDTAPADLRARLAGHNTNTCAGPP